MRRMWSSISPRTGDAVRFDDRRVRPAYREEGAIRIGVLAGRLGPDLDEAGMLAGDRKGDGHAGQLHVGELHRVLSRESPFEREQANEATASGSDCNGLDG